MGKDRQAGSPHNWMARNLRLMNKESQAGTDKLEAYCWSAREPRLANRKASTIVLAGRSWQAENSKP